MRILFVFLPEPSWLYRDPGRAAFNMATISNSFPSPVDGTQGCWAALKRDRCCDNGLHAIGQYFRLPSGTNTKPDGKGFRTRLVELRSVMRPLKAFIRGFNLDLDTVTAAEATAAGVWAGETIARPSAVGKRWALIPNDDLDYEQWVRVGHAIWGGPRVAASVRQ